MQNAIRSRPYSVCIVRKAVLDRIYTIEKHYESGRQQFLIYRRIFLDNKNEPYCFHEEHLED